MIGYLRHQLNFGQYLRLGIILYLITSAGGCGIGGGASCVSPGSRIATAETEFTVAAENAALRAREVQGVAQTAAEFRLADARAEENAVRANDLAGKQTAILEGVRKANAEPNRIAHDIVEPTEDGLRAKTTAVKEEALRQAVVAASVRHEAMRAEAAFRVAREQHVDSNKYADDRFKSMTTIAGEPYEFPSIKTVDADFALVQIFYGTDRNLNIGAPAGEKYGREPELELPGSIHYGTCSVSIPRNHSMGTLENASIFTFYRKDPNKQVVVLAAPELSRHAFLNLLNERVGRSEGKEAFVFIHGYNVAFEDAARRTAQIAYDLGFDGAPIMYSWPSSGHVLQYNSDLDKSTWTILHLKRFLEDVAKHSGASRIHLIAHSMGTNSLTHALKEMEIGMKGGDPPPFNEVILAAPDISAEIFKDQLAPCIRRTASHFTVYASSRDQALKLSMEINRGERAGQTDPKVCCFEGFDTIDASALEPDLLNHSYVFDCTSLLCDMFLLLRGERENMARGLIAKTSRDGDKYWYFNPAAEAHLALQNFKLKNRP